MGIHVIKMPDIGEGIAEVELVAWHVQPGDEIKEDQVLAEVMTDKAAVEIPSPVSGKVMALGGKPGNVMAVGSELIRLWVEGEGNLAAGAGNSGTVMGAATKDDAAKGGGATLKGIEPAADGAQGTAAPTAGSAPGSTAPGVTGSPPPSANATHLPPATAPAPIRVAPALSTAAPGSPPPTRAPGDKPLASPAVRRRAWEMGIELQFVHGSGPAGRILHEDLDTYATRGSPVVGAHGGTLYAARHDEQAIPVIGLRRRIAQKMQEAKRHIPHFTYVEEVDVTELEALRADLNARWAATRGKLTLLPFLMRAIVRAVPQFPQINARYDDSDDGGTVMQYGAVHVGIATQTANGLVVPVVRHAEARDLWSCAAEVTRLADAARAGKATREELTGSTITITSLGALGGIVTTPVINYPEVAIVGVNRIVERPMIRNGAVQARLIMNLSCSFDHRVVDGMHGAEFVQALRGWLEHPATLFIE